MKKILSVILISVMAVCFAGCGSSEPETDEYGNIVEVDGSTYTVYPEELPCTIDYNGSPVTFSSIDFYEDHSSYDYSLYMILRFDLSNLDDEQAYWFVTDSSIRQNFTSKDNDLNNRTFEYLGSYSGLPGEWITGYFTGLVTNYRYSFSGSEVNVKFTLEETEGDITERIIDYTTTVPDALPALDEMDTQLRLIYLQWLSNNVNAHAN